MNNLRIARSNVAFHGSSAFIVATCETSNSRFWRGHYLVLTELFPLANPIVSYEISSRRVGKDLTKLGMKAEQFLGHVLDHGKNYFQSEFFKWNEDEYLRLACSSNGISYSESDSTEMLNRLILNGPQDKLNLIQKFADVSDEYSFLGSPVSNLIDLRNSLVSKNVD